MYIPFEGFAPDLESNSSGIFTYCSNVQPTLRGFRGAPSPAASGMDTLADPCKGASLVTLLDTTKRLFAGTEDAIYERSGTSWVDRSKVGGYTAGTDGRWRFAQFGNETIAATKAEVLQSSISGDFADISGAPKAAIVDTVLGFVMALNTEDGTYGDNPDGWWCCALFDTGDWVPSIATQSARGRLVEIPGEFRAGRRLGDNFVAYKEKGMYVGRYTGPSDVWAWTPVPGQVGAVSQEAVINIETAHITLSWDNFYMFDGSRPVAIGNPIKKWFFDNLNASFADKVQGQHDPKNFLAKFYFPTNASADGTPDKCVVYNYKTQKWGVEDISIQAVVEYDNGGVTYDAGGAGITTFDGSDASLSYDSAFWTSSTVTPAVFDTNNDLVTLTGPCGSSSFVTGDVGDEAQYTTAQILFMRFQSLPTSATGTHIVKDSLGGAEENRPSVMLVGDRFDVLWTARWHRFQLNLNGDYEVLGMGPVYTLDGFH